jgi:hypothetical protein
MPPVFPNAMKYQNPCMPHAPFAQRKLTADIGSVSVLNIFSLSRSPFLSSEAGFFFPALTSQVHEQVIRPEMIFHEAS